MEGLQDRSRQGALDRLKQKRRLPSASAATGGKWSAAQSHALNDEYLDRFEEAHAQLCALQLPQPGVHSSQASPPQPCARDPRSGRQVLAAAPPAGSAGSTSSTAACCYPVSTAAGWRQGPIDAAGLCVSVCDQPVLCGSVDWSAGEVAVGSSDHAIYTVDLATGKRRRTLYNKSFGHAEWVSCMQYLPDGRLLSGGMDSKLCLWDARGVRCQDLRGHSGPISAVDILHQASSETDAGRSVQPAPRMSRASASAATRPAVGVSCSYDKSVRLWQIGSARTSEASCLTGHAAPVLNLACGHGSNIASGDRGGSVIIWDIIAQQAATRLKAAHDGHVTALAWQSGGGSLGSDVLLSGGQDGHVKLWDPRSSKCASDTGCHATAGGKGAVGNIIPAGPATAGMVVTAGADKTVCVLDPAASLQEVSKVKLSDFPYALTAAGGLAICGCGDGTVLVIDMATGQTRYGLGANKAAVRVLHASPNSLVCAGADGTVMLYSFV